MSSTEPRLAEKIAQGRNQRLMFELTITADDIHAFTSDPLHPGVAQGYVHSDVLGGRMAVERGWFNLFVKPDESTRRRMLYRLWLRDSGGSELTLVGFKRVGRRSTGPATSRGVLNVWPDTTTLFVRLLAGHVPPPAASTAPELAEALRLAGSELVGDSEVRGAGILHIRMPDLLHQLTTFRTRGPSGAAALVGFGRLFATEVLHAYGVEKS
jgi:cholesterol oxidase